MSVCGLFFFFSSRRRHTRSLCDWNSDVCSSDLARVGASLVLFAFWTGEAPTLADVTVLALPCSGRTELAIETEPSAQVTVEVAGARFGPRRADRQGRLK